MLPPEAYLEVRKTARYHLHLEILTVSLPASTPGMARVIARVETILRGDDSLSRGSRIAIELGIARKGDPLPESPDIWILIEKVKPGLWLEAYLNGEPPNYLIVSSQVSPIEAPD